MEGLILLANLGAVLSTFLILDPILPAVKPMGHRLWSIGLSLQATRSGPHGCA